MEAFIRPTLQQIYERIRGDIDSRLHTRSRPKISLIDILAKALAGLSHSLHGHIEYLAKNYLPDGARGLILERWAAIFGVYRKKETTAKGKVFLSALVEGATIPKDTILQSEDGEEYKNLEKETAVDGLITCQVISLKTGMKTNLKADSSMTLKSPIVGVNPNATVLKGGISGGTDKESDISLRQRLLQRIRNPPQGGAVSDYVRWAKEVPGVTRVFVYPMRQGAGSVDIAFVTDGGEDIIPNEDSETFKRVRKRLRISSPITATVNIISLKEKPLNITIKIHPNTEEVRASVTEEIKELLSREIPESNIKKDSTLRLSKIREAISQAEGEEYHTLTSPSEDIEVGETELVTFGEITWQD